VLVGEGVLWPAEQRLQAALAQRDRGEAGGEGEGDVTGRNPAHDATLMSRAAVAALVLLVVGTVLMVAQP
jgi:hypothetical protein